MSVGLIINKINGDIYKYDNESIDMPINTQNLDIIAQLIQNYYIIKINTLIQCEKNHKKKIQILNTIMPSINTKICNINVDPIYKNTICLDIVKYVCEQVAIVSDCLYKTIPPNVNFEEIKHIYQDFVTLESTLVSLCGEIHDSFSTRFEGKIIDTINDQLAKSIEIVKNICKEETFESDDTILTSCIYINGLIKQISDKYLKTTLSEKIKITVTSMIIQLYTEYLTLFQSEKFIKANSYPLDLLTLTTLIRMQDSVAKNKIMTDNSQCSQLVSQYYNNIVQIKKKIVGFYTTQFIELFIKSTNCSEYTKSHVSIKKILDTLNFPNKTECDIKFIIIDSIVQLLVINLLEYFISYKKIFTQEFIIIIDQVCCEFKIIVNEFIKSHCGEATNGNSGMNKIDIQLYTAKTFNKVCLLKKYITLCVSQNSEKKMSDVNKQQYLNDFKQIEVEFGNFEDGTNILQQLNKRRDMINLPTSGERSFGKKVFDLIPMHKNT
jgi:hypothetical protein